MELVFPSAPTQSVYSQACLPKMMDYSVHKQLFNEYQMKSNTLSVDTSVRHSNNSAAIVLRLGFCDSTYQNVIKLRLLADVFFPMNLLSRFLATTLNNHRFIRIKGTAVIFARAKIK